MKNIVQTNRYLSDRWFDFNGSVVHVIQNADTEFSVEVAVQEYLFYELQPVLHKIKILKNEE